MTSELRAAAAALDGTDTATLDLLRGAGPGHVFTALYAALSVPEPGHAPHPDLVAAVRAMHPDARDQIASQLQQWSTPGLAPDLRPVRGTYSRRLWAGLAAEFAAARAAVDSGPTESTAG